MNKYFEAVKDGGDFWRSSLSGALHEAHIWNEIATDAVHNDKYRLWLCEATEKKSRRVFQDWEVTRS